ncbi:MAG: hypothetical protein ABSC76_01390 [Terracidiphilus sp.]|jgi:hypothetical protein
MESNLRPLTLGEILDRTAQLYRTNFLLFAGISSVYAGALLVVGLLQIGLAETLRVLHMTEKLQWLTWTTTALAVVLVFLFYGAVMAAVSRAVAWVNLGKPATIRGAYRSILPRLGRYLWLMTLTFLVVFLPISVLYSGFLGTMAYFVKGFGTNPAAQQAAMSNPQTMFIVVVAFLVFILLLVPAGIYTALMGLRYSLAIPASVVEDMRARKAIRRSIDLAKGSWGRIFLLVLLIGAIKIGLVMITQIFVIVAAFKHPGQLPGPGIQALSQVIAFFTNTFLGPIYATGVTLFYYDQRIRKEGYDIEWMMQAAGLTPPEPSIETPSVAFDQPFTDEPWLALDAHFEAPPAPPREPPESWSGHE